MPLSRFHSSHSARSSVDFSSLHQARQFAIILLLMLSCHVLAMMEFEGLHLEDALWLTITTSTTVGFGDLAPKTTAGRLSTFFFIYMGGIVMAARIAVLYFDYLLERRMKILHGKWQWKMKKHLVFINAPEHGAAEYFEMAIADLRASQCERSEIPVVIHSDQFGGGLPERLRKLEVAHVTAEHTRDESLANASVKEADIIVILAKNTYDHAADSISFDLVHRLRSQGVKARIIVESTTPDNRQRLLEAGANNIIRPIRSYPELLVRSIVSPGSELVIEELISHVGATCTRYDLALHTSWDNIHQTLSKGNHGIPVGYVDALGKQHLSPSTAGAIEMKGLIVMSTSEQRATAQQLQKLFAA